MRSVCFLLLTLVALNTGCSSMKVTVSPGASGTVIDRRTHQPVAGAEVTMSRAWEREWPNYGTPTLDEALAKSRPPTVITGPNGKFRIPPEQKWITDFPAPEGQGSGTLIVRCPGYKPAIVPVNDSLPGDARAVVLTPINY